VLDQLASYSARDAAVWDQRGTAGSDRFLDAADDLLAQALVNNGF
jgi:hypothetical protein